MERHDEAVDQVVKFFDPLIVRWTGSNQWILTHELRCESAASDVIYIPAGATTDLASIPRVLWPVLSPAGRWARSSVLHDYLYENRVFERLKCDDLFLEAMRDDNVGSERNVIYRAVRLFGSAAYKND